MAAQEEFLKQLEDLLAYAKSSDSKISKKEIKEYFSDMKLSEEQLKLIVEYMQKHNVDVSGAKKTKDKEAELTETDTKYLNIYRKEMRALPVRDDAQMEEIYDKISNGDDNILNVAIEAHLKRVVTLATKYKNRGVFLEDLIQEGNIALIECIHGLLGKENTGDFKKQIDRAVRGRCIELVDEALEVDGLENSVLGKTNLLLEATKVLAEDLGRIATAEEVAEYTKLTMEEIMDLKELSLDEIKLGDVC